MNDVYLHAISEKDAIELLFKKAKLEHEAGNQDEAAYLTLLALSITAKG